MIKCNIRHVPAALSGLSFTYRPGHAKTCLRAYADGEGPDQPALQQSDQGLHFPLMESLGTTECIIGKKRPE